MTEPADLNAQLRELANKWVMKAREYARDAKAPDADPRTATYNRGIAETYHKLALELAEVIKNAPAGGGAPAEAAAPVEEAAPAVLYEPMSIGDVLRVLDYAGLNPRDVTPHKDNVFTAIFSRWHPLNDFERQQKMKAADSRIVILNVGKLSDTHDPYIDFAFKA
jgi:hypothetical protein